MAAKVVPGKQAGVSMALQYAVPMALRAIASTQSAGATVALTESGELTEETKRGILARIAGWFIPSEVKDVTKGLQADIIRLGFENFGEDAWKLEVRGGEIVLIVLNTSFLKVSADTAVDVFFNSLEQVRYLKDKLPLVGKK